MRRRFARHRRGWLYHRLRVGLLVLCCIGIAGAAYFGVRPVLTDFAESQAVWIATKTANRIVESVLAEYTDLCRDMIEVTYTETNHLASVFPDIASVNMVRTAITDGAMSEMEKHNVFSVSIPLGTLLGVDWLSGWGPPISFPISFTSTVISDVTSSFEAVGINQSIYRVLIHLDVNLLVVTPGGRTSVGSQMSYPMAEAVLLGEVPDNLTEVYGDDQTLLGRIFDYGTAE